MIVYHMSDKLKIGNEIILDHDNTQSLASPFIQALKISQDCFYAMLLNSKYMRAVLLKHGLREWSNYVKWSCEGAFEYIRQTEFSHCCSRLHCAYYYDSLSNCKRMFDVDFAMESNETREKIHLYEIELTDDTPDKFDMQLFDMAYDVIDESRDISLVFQYAREYFSGQHTSSPIWEILSDKPAKVISDITKHLYKK